MSHTILDTIVEHKQKEVAERKAKVSLEEIQKNIQKSDISFFDALKGKNRVHLIAEIKFASPSRGNIVSVGNNDRCSLLEKTIRLYNRYASAMSILTDKHFFQGSFDNLKTARKNSHLPLLCKDFMIDEYQIFEARAAGANAILLIAAILTQDEMKHFYQTATDLKIDCLFEVHNEEELEKILPLKPRIIGVNNRNLKDFSIDHELTNKLSSKIPEDAILVAESGISCLEDVQNVEGIADAMLVGTSIMGAENPEEKIKELTQLPTIKICGITNTKDALEAVKCGASYIGIIFAPSPRHVNIEQAKEVIAAVKKEAPEVKVVGVFVNEAQVWSIGNDLQLDVVQLHGDETEVDIKKGKELFNGEIWKTKSIEKDVTLDLSESDITTDKILLDTANTSEQRGGSGKSFDWSILKNFQLSTFNFQLILAGGINPSNISNARDYAPILDIGSGVEKEKGKKDYKKLQALFWDLKK